MVGILCLWKWSQKTLFAHHCTHTRRHECTQHFKVHTLDEVTECTDHKLGLSNTHCDLPFAVSVKYYTRVVQKERGNRHLQLLRQFNCLKSCDGKFPSALHMEPLDVILCRFAKRTLIILTLLHPNIDAHRDSVCLKHFRFQHQSFEAPTMQPMHVCERFVLHLCWQV